MGLDVTMHDDAKSKRDRLDFVRNSRGSDRLTRPIDLTRKWSYVTDVSLDKDYLVWKRTERKRVGDHCLLDGEIARQAIVRQTGASFRTVGDIVAGPTVLCFHNRLKSQRLNRFRTLGSRGSVCGVCNLV
jgi:hypothetical protein